MLVERVFLVIASLRCAFHTGKHADRGTHVRSPAISGETRNSRGFGVRLSPTPCAGFVLRWPLSCCHDSLTELPSVASLRRTVGTEQLGRMPPNSWTAEIGNKGRHGSPGLELRVTSGRRMNCTETLKGKAGKRNGGITGRP